MTTNGPQSDSQKEAAQHIAEARTLLEQMRGELDQHPGLEEAIRRLESALSLLTTQSGGLL